MRAHTQLRQIDPVLERQIVQQIYGKHVRPNIFRYYDPGCEEIVDLAHRLEPVHNRHGSRDFEPGEEIVRQDQPCRGIYVIEKGCCEEFNADRLEEKPTILSSGDCFGQMAALGFGSGPRNRDNILTVKAKEASGNGGGKLQLKFISVENLRQLFEKHPDMETMLKAQVGVMRSKQKLKQRMKRLEQEPNPFPTTKAASDKFFADLHRDPTNRGAKNGNDNFTLSYKAVLSSLDKWSADLPISTELPRATRCAQCDSANQCHGHESDWLALVVAGCR